MSEEKTSKCGLNLVYHMWLDVHTSNQELVNYNKIKII